MKNFVFVRMKNASFYLVHCCWHEFQGFGRSNHLWAYNHVDASCMMMSSDKVPEYPFKQNKNMLNNMEVLLCTYFYNASLNVLRPTFFNIYIIYLFHALQISGNLGSTLGQKLTTFLALWAPAPTELQFFIIFYTDM